MKKIIIISLLFIVILTLFMPIKLPQVMSTNFDQKIEKFQLETGMNCSLSKTSVSIFNIFIFNFFREKFYWRPSVICSNPSYPTGEIISGKCDGISSFVEKFSSEIDEFVKDQRFSLGLTHPELPGMACFFPEYRGSYCCSKSKESCDFDYDYCLYNLEKLGG